MPLQLNLKEILTKLNKKYQLEVVIVMPGLKPPCLWSETAGLENSYNLWKGKEDQLYSQILQRYGASFYQQELANAASETGNEFFVAPFTASAQLAIFFKDLMINVCFGSPALLGYEAIDQAITSFDLEASSFTFMDRGDSGLTLAQVRSQLVEGGLVYPHVKYQAQ